MTSPSSSSLVERVASISCRTTVAVNVGFAAVAGAWAGRYDGSLAAVLVQGCGLAVATGVVTLVMLGMILAPLRRLSRPQRRAVVDAGRFGQSVGDPELVDAFLGYANSRSKLVTRSATNTMAATLALMAGFSLYVALRMAGVGQVADTAFFAAMAALGGISAAIWPAVGRATRRNVEAARQAALALRTEHASA